MEQSQCQAQVLPLLALGFENPKALAVHKEEPQLVGLSASPKAVQCLRRVPEPLEQEKCRVVVVKEEAVRASPSQEFQHDKVKEVSDVREHVAALQPVVGRVGCKQVLSVGVRPSDKDLPENSDEEPRVLVVARRHAVPKEMLKHSL